MQHYEDEYNPINVCWLLHVIHFVFQWIVSSSAKNRYFSDRKSHRIQSQDVCIQIGGHVDHGRVKWQLAHSPRSISDVAILLH